MINEDLTLFKVLAFFKAFKGDDIIFENAYCGNYTDLYSEINSVGISTLRVEVNQLYTNSRCVDEDNLTEVTIDSIRNIVNKNTPFKEFEIDGKIICLKAFLSINKIHFNSSDQKSLDTLLQRLELFYSEIIFEGTNIKDSVNRKIERMRFNNLFMDLN